MGTLPSPADRTARYPKAARGLIPRQGCRLVQGRGAGSRPVQGAGAGPRAGPCAAGNLRAHPSGCWGPSGGASGRRLRPAAAGSDILRGRWARGQWPVPGPGTRGRGPESFGGQGLEGGGGGAVEGVAVREAGLDLAAAGNKEAAGLVL